MKRFQKNSIDRIQRLSRFMTYEQFEQRVVLAADVMSSLIGAGSLDATPSPFDDAALVAEDDYSPGIAGPSVETCGLPAEISDSVCAPTSNVITPELTFDLSDGSDGLMTSLAGRSELTIGITASMDGRLEIHGVSDATGPGTVNMALIDGSGNVLATTACEEVGNDVFQTLAADVQSGDQLQLVLTNRSSESVDVQATAGIEELPASAPGLPTDTMNLILPADGEVIFRGSLENDRDQDHFQFTTEAAGRTSLNLLDQSDQDQLRLTVTVTDLEGNIVAEGMTNEEVELAFDAAADQTFNVTIAESNGVTADYEVAVATQSTVPDEAIGTCPAAVEDAIPPATSEPDCDLPVADSPIADSPNADDEPAQDLACEPAAGPVNNGSNDAVDSTCDSAPAPDTPGSADDTCANPIAPNPSDETTDGGCPVNYEIVSTPVDNGGDGNGCTQIDVAPDLPVADEPSSTPNSIVFDNSLIGNVWIVGRPWSFAMPSLTADAQNESAGSLQAASGELAIGDPTGGVGNVGSTSSARTLLTSNRLDEQWVREFGAAQRSGGTVGSEIERMDRIFEEFGLHSDLQLAFL